MEPFRPPDFFRDVLPAWLLIVLLMVVAGISFLIFVRGLF